MNTLLYIETLWAKIKQHPKDFLKGLWAKVNQNHFVVGYILVTLGLVYFANTVPYPALRIFSSALNSIALWLGTMIGLVYFFNGTGCDVHKEIVDEHNVALGILIGLYGLAIAIAIKA
jgi:hypothetical protein